MLKTLCLLFIFTISCFPVKAQDENPNVEKLRLELFSAYGYCKSQGWTLQEISKNFPQLKVGVLQADSEFSLIFGQSCKNIQDLISKIPGVNLETYDKALKEKLAEAIDYSQLTLKVSTDFIGTVRKRANGDIASPFKEILLAFNPVFDGNPAAEFSRGFTKKYRTANHPKAKGLDFEVSVPESWKAREGNRPNIIQFFKGKNGYTDPSMSLMVMEIPMPTGLKPTQKDINSVFTPSGLKDFMPENATFVEGKPIVLEGQKGGMLVYDAVMQRLELKLKMRSLSYIIYYKKHLIMLQFATGGKEEDTASIVKDFNKNRPLFQLIANSLVIMDKYKQN
jgi:hypothetical protein